MVTYDLSLLLTPVVVNCLGGDCFVTIQDGGTRHKAWEHEQLWALS